MTRSEIAEDLRRCTWLDTAIEKLVNLFTVFCILFRCDRRRDHFSIILPRWYVTLCRVARNIHDRIPSSWLRHWTGYASKVTRTIPSVWYKHKSSLFSFENLQNERNPQARCYAVFQLAVLTGLTGLLFVICFQIGYRWLLVHVCRVRMESMLCGNPGGNRLRAFTCGRRTSWDSDRESSLNV